MKFLKSFSEMSADSVPLTVGRILDSQNLYGNKPGSQRPLGVCSGTISVREVTLYYDAQLSFPSYLNTFKSNILSIKFAVNLYNYFNCQL